MFCFALWPGQNFCKYYSILLIPIACLVLSRVYRESLPRISAGLLFVEPKSWVSVTFFAALQNTWLVKCNLLGSIEAPIKNNQGKQENDYVSAELVPTCAVCGATVGKPPLRRANGRF